MTELHLYEMPWTGKSGETEYIDGYLGGGEWGGEGERLLTGTGYVLGVVRMF